jgi:hypothetical protein
MSTRRVHPASMYMPLPNDVNYPAKLGTSKGAVLAGLPAEMSQVADPGHCMKTQLSENAFSMRSAGSSACASSTCTPEQLRRRGTTAEPLLNYNETN